MNIRANRLNYRYPLFTHGWSNFVVIVAPVVGVNRYSVLSAANAVPTKVANNISATRAIRVFFISNLLKNYFRRDDQGIFRPIILSSELRSRIIECIQILKLSRSECILLRHFFFNQAYKISIIIYFWAFSRITIMRLCNIFENIIYHYNLTI